LQRGKLSKGIQELDDLFQKTIQQSIEELAENDLLEGKIGFGSKHTQLNAMATVLSESLEQIGPITGFLQIYSATRSAFLVSVLAQDNAAAKDQDVKIGYSRETYQNGTSLLIPYAKHLILVVKGEYDAISGIITKAHINSTFVNTITAAIDCFLESCESLLNRVRRSIQRRKVIYILNRSMIYIS
jgi:hypothetical protein